MAVGKRAERDVRRRIETARRRGEDLCAMHPWEVAQHMDAMAQDEIYPRTLEQAAAKGRLSPAVWQIALRDGWRRELARRQLVLDLGKR